MKGKFDVNSLLNVPKSVEEQFVRDAILDLYHAVDHGEEKWYGYTDARDRDGAKAKVVTRAEKDPIAALVAVALADRRMRGHVQFDAEGNPLVTYELLQGGARCIERKGKEYGADVPYFMVNVKIDLQKQAVGLTFMKTKTV